MNRHVERTRRKTGTTWRNLLVWPAALLVLVPACQQSAPSASKRAAGPWQAQTTQTNTARAVTRRSPHATKPKTKSAPKRPPPPAATVVPVIECRGVVISVNEQSRFVVADFSFNPRPQPEQRLGLFRAGQRVGEVRASSFTRGSLVAADILSGDAKPNDEVRAE